MKFRKTIITLSILSMFSSVFADNLNDDPILGLAGHKPNSSDSQANVNNNKPSTTSSQQPKNTAQTTRKPTTPSVNPDDDDEDFPTDDKPKDNNFGSLNNGSDAVTNMLLQSVSLMGIRYKWGGNTPTSGMDCSGFVRYVYQKSLGINLPRTAAEQAKVGKRVSIDDLQPGDLMFFNSKRGSNTHVGMYLGNNKFIQSPRTGDVIKISEFTDSWRKRFNGAKRIVSEKTTPDGNSDLNNLQNVRDEPLPVAYRAKSSKHSTHGSRSSRNKNSRKSQTSTKSKSNSTSKSVTTSKSSSKKSTNNSKSTSTSTKKTSTKKSNNS
ncbi:MAG: peptidoglycan endopeptidase [Neisseriaceae bacterium]|nr:MAG: peptidoglycan endopeptidase [Neisseriaceae bacterium]